ncbi:hypothetical protein PWT90_08178 [Aphanocladium album]|nr:hypothetical protein PWT90_08178 [Aphanocladium album]
MSSQSFLSGPQQRPVTKLLEECLAGDATAVRATLTAADGHVNIEAELGNGWTALQVATRYQYFDIVRLLIEHGAKLDVTGGPQGTSPLYMAVAVGNIEIARVLLENNANPNRSAFWDAPLHVAVRSENQEVVQLLLDAGAFTESVNCDGETPLIIAAMQGSVNIAKQLLDRGANPNSSKAKFNSPLLAACQGGHVEVAAMLLDRGASVDRADVNDLTPLFFAVQADNVYLAKLLLRRGASTNIRGSSILESPALEIQNSEMLQALQVQGPIQGPRITTSTAGFKPKESSEHQFIRPPSEDDVYKQNACHGFDVTMIDFYVSSGVEERLPITASVHSVLYGDGPKALLHAAREEAHIRHEPDFTWYHIPTNNMTWAEHLITRLRAEKADPHAAKRQMKLQRLKQSVRTRLNFAHLKQSKGVTADDMFLKPVCSRDIALEDEATDKAIVLVLPYLHFETFQSFESMSNALKAAKAHAKRYQANRAHVYPGEVKDDISEVPVQNLSQANSLPSLTSSIHGRHDGRRVMSPSSIAEYGGAGINRAWSTGQEPYMSHNRRQWDATSFRTFPPARLKSQEAAEGGDVKGLPPPLVAPPPAPKTNKKVPKKANAFASLNLHHDLTMGYMGGRHVDDRGFQPRRTLDAYKYHHLGSIAERDADQVIYRYTKAKNQEPKIFMVDQLWMWVLEDDTLVTCAPLRWNTIAKDVPLVTRLISSPAANPFAWWRIFPALQPRIATERGPQLRRAETTVPIILERLKDLRRLPIVSVHGLASFVAANCVDVFDQRLIPDEYQFFDFFEQCLMVLFDKGAQCLKEVHEAVESSSICSITLEIESLIEVADILDELEILKAVLEDQRGIVSSLNNILDGRNSTSSDGDDTPSLLFSVDTSVLESHLARILAMERSAKKIEDSFYRITDLKQKHASQQEAAAAAQQAKETARQGNAILLFTVVTIVFLPISFMAAFFAINIDGLQTTTNGKLPLTYVVKYMLAVGLCLSIPFIFVAFNLDVVAKGVGVIKRLAKSLVDKSVMMACVGLIIGGVIVTVLWTSHLATNVKTTVTVVIGLALIMGLLAIWLRDLMGALRAVMGTPSTSPSRSGVKTNSIETIAID